MRFDARTCGIVTAAFAERPLVELPVDDDEAFVRAALAGRGDAFGVLVERYERAVFTLTLRMMRNREDASDAAQDAFYRAYRSLHTFRPGAKFSTWLFTIAHNGCIDRLNRRKRFSNDEIPDYADVAPGPEATSVRNDEAVHLRAAIDALPEKYRVVVTLYHLQHRQYEEIASVLGLPIGTVKTHLFRAKELLRKRLTEMER
jgi:RNA polymerase sigma-70 factor (ECF subfamily)